MAEMNLLQAVHNALDFEMGRDDDVLVFGEDVGGAGGVFRTTAGLQEKYGENRCFDTPLSEAGIVGTAIGMAVYGLKPVAEIQFLDFIYPAFDQIINEAAKMRYRSGGQFTCPMVIRTPYGGGIRGGHYHSQSGEAYFAHTPGLKVVVPSNPADTKGLLLASIRDPDPVLFFEPKRIYRASKGEVPEGDHVVPLGKAKVVRSGSQVTVVTFGAMVEVVLKAAEAAAQKGIDTEVVDLRTLVPLDWETVETSVKKTGRILTVYEAPKTCGYGAEISALVAEKLILHLEAPILRVAGYDTPYPYALEELYLPTSDRILEAVEEVANY